MRSGLPKIAVLAVMSSFLLCSLIGGPVLETVAAGVPAPRPRGLLKHYIRAKKFSHQLKSFLKLHGGTITAAAVGTAIGAFGTGFALKHFHEQKMDAVREAYTKQEEDIVERYENDKRAVAEERQRAWEAREQELIALKNYLMATFDSNVKAAREEFDRRRVEMIDSVNRALVDAAREQKEVLEAGVERFTSSGESMLGQTQGMIEKALIAQQDRLLELQAEFKSQEKALFVKFDSQFDKLRADYERAVSAQQENYRLLEGSMRSLSSEQHEILLKQIAEEQESLKGDFEKQQALLRSQVAQQQEQLQKAQEEKAEAFVHNALSMMQGVTHSATQLHEATAYYAGMAGQAAYGAAGHAAAAYQQIQDLGAQQKVFGEELKGHYVQQAEQQKKEYALAAQRQEAALRKYASTVLARTGQEKLSLDARKKALEVEKTALENDAATKIQALVRKRQASNRVTAMKVARSSGHNQLPVFKRADARALPAVPKKEVDEAMGKAIPAAGIHTLAQQLPSARGIPKMKTGNASVGALVGPEMRPLVAAQ